MGYGTYGPTVLTVFPSAGGYCRPPVASGAEDIGKFCCRANACIIWLRELGLLNNDANISCEATLAMAMLVMLCGGFWLLVTAVDTGTEGLGAASRDWPPVFCTGGVVISEIRGSFEEVCMSLVEGIRVPSLGRPRGRVGGPGVPKAYEISDGAGENASLGCIEGEVMDGSGVEMVAYGARNDR